MSPPDALAIIALTTLALFAVSFASLTRLTCAGVLEGRNADGSPSLEAILHSIAKMIMVIVITVAQSRILLAPDWPGGSFAPDLSILLAGGVSLIASVPAAGLLAMTVRSGARPPPRCPHGRRARRDCRHRSRAGGDERNRSRSRPRRAACAIRRGSNPCLRPCRRRGPVPSRPTCPSAPRATEQYPSRARRHCNERDLDHALCLAWLPGLRDISLAFRNRTYADARLRTGMCFLPQSFSPTRAGAKSRPFSDSRYSYRSGRCEYAFLSRTP